MSIGQHHAEGKSFQALKARVGSGSDHLLNGVVKDGHDLEEERLAPRDKGTIQQKGGQKPPVHKSLQSSVSPDGQWQQQEFQQQLVQRCFMRFSSEHHGSSRVVAGVEL